jgi:nucleoside-diphosphate-sugar epimerase
MKRFVLTSSSSSSVGLLDSGGTVTEDTWNDKAVEKAWSGPPYEPYRPIIVYEASNVQSERAVWKFHEDSRASRPDLDVNTSE